MPQRSWLKLSVGSGTLGKVVRGVLALAGLAGFLLFVLALIVMPLAEGTDDLWSMLAGGVVLGLGCFLFALFNLTGIRYAMWVDRTWLGQRSLTRTTWVDLATAEIDTKYVEFHQTPSRPHEHYLVARSQDAGNERGIRLELRVSDTHYGAAVPARELHVVADAITRNRERTHDDDRAFLIAGYLRHLAADPTTNIQRLDEQAPTRAPQDTEQEPAAQTSPTPQIPPGIDEDKSFATHVVKVVAIVSLISVPVLVGIVALGYATGNEGPAIAIALGGAVAGAITIRHEFRRLRIWRQRDRRPGRHRGKTQTGSRA